MASASTPSVSAAPKELRGEVLQVLSLLLSEGKTAEVLALCTKLVARNHELELLLAKLRGAKNRGEQLSSAQLALALEELKKSASSTQAEADQALEQSAKDNAGRIEPPKPPKQPPVRRKPSPRLRRVDNFLPVPKDERPCPVCSKERTCLCHETTEVIDLIPAEVIVRRDIREVLACEHCEAELVRAPRGDKVISAGAYGSRLVAELVVNKYQDGLPLYRQGQMLERLGLSMPSSSMSDQITWATELLRPLWLALLDNVLISGVLHVDGTSLPVLDRSGPTGITTGALWGYVGDAKVAAYLYTSTAKKRGQLEGEIGPEQFLANRTGPIVADASNLFDKLFTDPAKIEVGCNMHARRYFVKALESGDSRAAVPLSAFQTLYDVEASVADLDLSARQHQREQRSKPVYTELIRWCETYLPSEPPASLLGRALRYLLNHQIALTRFLDDGLLPIDNGIVERLHRRPALSRRAFLFAGSHAAGERAAIAYSVLATCSLLEINPTDYLADVLPRLARGLVLSRDLPPLLPFAWKQARSLPTP